MEVHHRIRRRDGGDRFSNLLALLPECHRWITEHPETAREFGWILLVGSDPMACPVWISERRWLLDDFGGRRPEP